MRYIRPEAVVEAMFVEATQDYLVMWGDSGAQEHMSVHEFERHFQPLETKRQPHRIRTTLTCKVCKVQFQAKRTTRLFCSNACRFFAYRQRKTMKPVQETTSEEQ